MNKILLGDCLQLMKELPDNSVDSIVTDPPYGLSFMGKKWDYDVPSVEIWQECLRVLKPGGYLLAFAGTRTQHRMAVRIEDAGFEIRDMIAWVYGSGFPKSLNIGKAVDKLQGNEREVIGKGSPMSSLGTMHDDNWESDSEYNETKGTSEWEGYGTALKPALEPITVARKPLSEKTVAENVLKWGTGGINIDGCRVEGTQEYLDGKGNSTQKKQGDVYGFANYDKLHTRAEPNQSGRFPANFIHDGSQMVLDLFPENAGAAAPVAKGQNGDSKGIYGDFDQKGDDGASFYNDSGSAARFFYCAKASKSERNAGNNHPTVKPIKLMSYLVRLVTPAGGIVLDPFAGSGTTALSAIKEGVDFIVMERDPQYIEIIQHRVNYFLHQHKKI